MASSVSVRARILDLLSEGEMANIGMPQAAADMRKGDEYLDLEHLGLGVLRAVGSRSEHGDVLPRKAIHEDTWRRVLRGCTQELRRRRPGRPKPC